MKSVRPGHEGMWSPVLATFIFVAMIYLGSMIGIGIWRFTDQEAARRHNNNLINQLNTDIDDLINFVENITLPNNCSFDTSNITQPTKFSDEAFRIFGDLDPTKEMAFNASGIPGVTLRILTLQNVSGTVAYLSDVISQSTTFLDNAFAVQRFDSTTRQVMFDLSGLSLSTTRILTIQDASGTIAYLTDIPIQPSVFLDDAFGVVNLIDDSKQVMLNCSGIAPFTSQVMSVQDKNGTIAYLSDITSGVLPPFSDDVFIVYLAGNPSARTQLQISGLSANTTVVMSVQDASGVIAYLGDILQIVEVLVTTNRNFPDVGNEGVATLAELGDLSHIEISLCGGGGSGGATGDAGAGGGGGSGGGFENFMILEPDDKFTHFEVAPGFGGITPGFGVFPTSGNETTVLGVSASGFTLQLIGYGGGGGASSSGSFGGSPARTGGAGGGGGGNGASGTPGIAGVLGGLPGGAGGSFLTGPFSCVGNLTFGVRGGFKLPWRSGGGGGRSSTVPCHAAAWQGGGKFFIPTNQDGWGASSMFGSSASPGAGPTALCAGGSTGVPFPQDGGDGAAIFRYFIL